MGLCPRQATFQIASRLKCALTLNLNTVLIPASRFHGVAPPIKSIGPVRAVFQWVIMKKGRRIAAPPLNFNAMAQAARAFIAFKAVIAFCAAGFLRKRKLDTLNVRSIHLLSASSSACPRVYSDQRSRININCG